MSQIQQTIEYLEKAEVGSYVENLDNGREVVAIQVQVMVREIIDYTLSRKGHRQYIVTDMDGEIVNEGGNWKTLNACKNRIKELGMIHAGTVTVNQNYKHWADFFPVKIGEMLDDQN